MASPRVQQTPLTTFTSSQLPVHASRAPYGPPSVRQWVQKQDPNPSNHAISVEHLSRQLGIHQDQQEYPALAGNNFLHPYFCHNAADRKLTFHEGSGDIRDAVCTVIYLQRGLEPS